MFMSERPQRASEARISQSRTHDAALAGRPAQGAGFEMTDFYGSVADWCDQGFSICEGYLIEAQNLYLKGDFAGFVSMAEAQSDDELEEETLSHINTLLSGLAFCRRAGEVQVVGGESGASGLNWKKVAQLYSAMETTKGDMRMPRLDRDFERKLRAAMVLS
ncbi:hypothetical protein [Paracoccus lutimaris]|nr:hypothetical protein [Paracoccus lutimaris]